MRQGSGRPVSALGDESVKEVPPGQQLAHLEGEGEGEGEGEDQGGDQGITLL